MIQHNKDNSVKHSLEFHSLGVSLPRLFITTFWFHSFLSLPPSLFPPRQALAHFQILIVKFKSAVETDGLQGRGNLHVQCKTEYKPHTSLCDIVLNAAPSSRFHVGSWSEVSFCWGCSGLSCHDTSIPCECGSCPKCSRSDPAPCECAWEISKRWLNCLGPWHSHGELYGILGSWFQPGLVPTVVVIWERTSRWEFTLSHCVFAILSNK